MKRKNQSYLIIALFVLIIATVAIETNSSLFNIVRREKERPTLELEPSSESGGGYTMNTETSYSWVEISSTGAIMTDISDADEEYQTIVFPTWKFNFYGREYDKIHVSLYGWMSFTCSTPDSQNIDIPSYHIHNYDCVAVCMTGIDTDESNYGGGTIYYQFLSSPDRLVIEYENVFNDEWEDSEEIGTFEVIFYASGNILFQYHHINDVPIDPIVGLDHGDGINYNVFTGLSDENLPLSSKAISYAFNALIPVPISINYSVNDEQEWIVSKINRDKMDLWFGTSWENDFGLLANPNRGEKTKIKIVTIATNDTHWELNYSSYSWTPRFHAYSSVPSGNSSLVYHRDPLNYTQEHELPNYFPLIVPKPAPIYLFRANLSNFYEDLFFDDEDNTTSAYIYQYRTINNHDIEVDGSVIYDFNGTLIRLSLEMHNLTNYQVETIFELELLTEGHLTNYSLTLQVDDELEWAITAVNDTMMEIFLGANWEQEFGLFSNPQTFDKFNIQITSIADNTTHWDIDYDVWNWTNVNNDFSLISDGSDNIVYRQDPYNYTEMHYLPHLIPLFLPQPPANYLSYDFLNESFYEEIDCEDTNPYIYIDKTKVINGHDIEFDLEVNYLENGFLERLYIDWYNDTSNEEGKAFEMYLFFEPPAPSYVGITAGETFEYGVFHSVVNAPESFEHFEPDIPDRFKISMEFICGQNPYTNSTLILFNYTEFFEEPSPIGTWSNFETFAYNLFNTSSNFFSFIFWPFPPYYFHAIGANNVPWDLYPPALESLFNEDYPESNSIVESLGNGLKISINNQGITHEVSFTYNANGFLNIASLSYNGKEYLTIRYNDFDYHIDEGGGGGDDDDDDNTKTSSTNIPGQNIILIILLSSIGLIYLTRRTRNHINF